MPYQTAQNFTILTAKKKLTKTTPYFSGSFSDAQRGLYDAVLEVQEACVKLCGHHDMTLDVIFQEMLGLIAQQLRRLGIAKQGVEGMELYRVSKTGSGGNGAL